jgi:hypothetical protein
MTIRPMTESYLPSSCDIYLPCQLSNMGSAKSFQRGEDVCCGLLCICIACLHDLRPIPYSNLLTASWHSLLEGPPYYSLDKASLVVCRISFLASVHISHIFARYQVLGLQSIQVLIYLVRTESLTLFTAIAAVTKAHQRSKFECRFGNQARKCGAWGPVKLHSCIVDCCFAHLSQWTPAARSSSGSHHIIQRRLQRREFLNSHHLFVV